MAATSSYVSMSPGRGLFQQWNSVWDASLTGSKKVVILLNIQLFLIIRIEGMFSVAIYILGISETADWV